jgi:RNA polymerase sigma-70 factor, ECF subfamily
MTAASEVTQALAAWSAGDRQALERVVPLVYGELRGLAARQLRRERSGHTLQPTALVNEVFLRLAGRSTVQLEARAEFFALAAQAMRRILVDHARKRHAARRGGNATAVSIEEVVEGGPQPAVGVVDMIVLDTALAELEGLDPRQARVVELKYFAGLSIDEIAALLGISNATVRRDWAMARAWLRRELERSLPSG